MKTSHYFLVLLSSIFLSACAVDSKSTQPTTVKESFSKSSDKADKKMSHKHEKKGICADAIVVRQYKETGSLAAKVRTQHRKRKFSDEDLLNYIEQYPSATL